MSFECLHCGKCCNNIAAQINVTLGDIKRLSGYTGKTISQIVPYYISINPFGSPESDLFELDLGLNMPCKFREKNRCSVYKARPINCRLFPFWIIASVQINGIHELMYDSPCIAKARITTEDQKRCKQYTEALSKILLKESEFTDEMLNQIIPKRSVSMEDFPGHKRLVIPDTDERKKDEVRIKWLIKQLRKHKNYGNLPKIIETKLCDTTISKELTSLSVLDSIDEKTKPF